MSRRSTSLARLLSLLLATSLEGCNSAGNDEADASSSGGGSGGSASSGGTASGSGSAKGSGGNAAEGLLLEEDDPSVCGALGIVTSEQTGFSGSGYFDGIDKRGASLSFIVNAAVAGDVNITIRYANGDAEARPLKVRVAHADSLSVSLPSSGAWNAWSEVTKTVTFGAGKNHLSLVAESDAGLPNIDSIRLDGGSTSGSSCDEYAPGADVTFTTPTFKNVSVHDPSVIDVEGTRYVFGSHLAAAKTTDWMQWTLVTGDGVNADNPLFDNVVTELSEAFSWSTVTGLWAADVLRLKSTGKFLMYYNSCKGDEAVSAMGIATASNIEGPYVDDGLILESGFYYHSQKNPDGSNNDTAVDPNAIDPDAFYDATGKPWLVYGSYSGGIFVLELDPATGKPKSGQNYYGTHVLGGGHAPIEGPFIQYNAASDYYYLFTSYGGLLSTDGYNMRVARSKKPSGPYVDAGGIDQATIKAPGDITEGGVKIMGNHQWEGTNAGYLSAGHNSTFRDEAAGRDFLIFHTRFPGKGEYHEIRVHEMFVNLDGWFVASPLRYAPRANVSELPQATIEYIGKSEVAGTYQTLNHGRDMSGSLKTSSNAAFSSDGTVSGALNGTWTFGGNNVIIIELGGVTFSGVLSRQWNEAKSEFEVTFSALNAAGEALWGIRTAG